MSHLPKSLHEIFPGETDVLRRLKAGDRHFQLLVSRYEDIDGEVRKMEAGEDPASDERFEAARKLRLAVLDEIATLIASHKAA
ncbi:MAG: DUF465 domain-containing protein [Sandarakinorhabdus sp.]|nr:DUF465 domain-containing protein [Sandarakinorhabdus sp.]